MNDRVTATAPLVGVDLADNDLNALKSELASLAAENAKLRSTLAERRGGHSPDQLAAAIQHSADTFQSRFAAMVNPTSNFALKELRLDANLILDVSPLGQVTYRFPQDGEAVDEKRLCKLVLDIVPVPKQTLQGTYTAPNFDATRSLEDVSGIGARTRALLQQHQLYSLQDLLSAGTRARSQVELAALLGVGRNELANWLAQAELLTLRGMTGGQAQVLGALAVKGLGGLAAWVPGELAEKFNAWIAGHPRKGVGPLALDAATRWVQAAKAFAGKS